MHFHAEDGEPRREARKTKKGRREKLDEWKGNGEEEGEGGKRMGKMGDEDEAERIVGKIEWC